MGIIIVGGLVWAVWGGKNGSNEDTSLSGAVPAVTSSSTASSSDSISGRSSFTDLLALGKTMECSFLIDQDGIAGEGTGFFDGKKMRVDTMYTATSADVVTSNMISDGSILYLWNTEAGETVAFKMAVPAEGSTSSVSDLGTSTTQVNPQASVPYTCKPWKVDGSVFVPPPTIQFMDVATMMDGLL